jgi:hypothetical protein
VPLVSPALPPLPVVLPPDPADPAVLPLVTGSRSEQARAVIPTAARIDHPRAPTMPRLVSSPPGFRLARRPEEKRAGETPSGSQVGVRLRLGCCPLRKKQYPQNGAVTPERREAPYGVARSSLWSMEVTEWVGGWAFVLPAVVLAEFHVSLAVSA